MHLIKTVRKQFLTPLKSPQVHIDQWKNILNVSYINTGLVVPTSVVIKVNQKVKTAFEWEFIVENMSKK